MNVEAQDWDHSHPAAEHNLLSESPCQHRIFPLRPEPCLQVNPIGFRLRVVFSISSPRNQLQANSLLVLQEAVAFYPPEDFRPSLSVRGGLG